jgi:malonyl-CoA/methylmalonyl-CoA synthetase
MNTYAYFAHCFMQTPSQIFIETDAGESFSYAEVDRETARYANFLMGLSLRLGDRVAVQVDKSPQAVFLYLACLRAGLCYLPLNNAYQQGEIRYFLADAEPAIAICSPQNQGWYADLCKVATVANLYTLTKTAAALLRTLRRIRQRNLPPPNHALKIWPSLSTHRAPPVVQRVRW